MIKKCDKTCKKKKVSGKKKLIPHIVEIIDYSIRLYILLYIFLYMNLHSDLRRVYITEKICKRSLRSHLEKHLNHPEKECKMGRKINCLCFKLSYSLCYGS